MWLAARLLLLAAWPGVSSPALAALSPEQALAMAQGGVGARVEAIQAAAVDPDPALEGFLRALNEGRVHVADGRVLVLRGDGSAVDVASGETLAALPAGAEAVVNNNRVRRALAATLAGLDLFAKSPQARAQAIDRLDGGRLDASMLPLIERALAAETDPSLQARLQSLRAGALLQAEDPAQRLQAAKLLGGSDLPAVKALLASRLADGGETDPAVRQALQEALAAVGARLAWGERLGLLFGGVSLGSILVLVALGLAITYGLLGVINMAHGELMMIGAYATWAVQNLFRSHWPQAFDAYILAAVPAAFLAAALVGAAIERSVIRWLYGRPLETLLATWGISLILMQGVRSLFGAQNVQVSNPSWLSGGVQVMSNLVLPWNRIAIVAFAAAVLALVALAIARTRLGLFVRAVTQNRRMAACTGVDTAKVDTLAFALGSGIAGLAGCALTQVGNVGPELGQGYIVDAFMVVVTGGVGQLSGTVYAGLGLGVLNKFFEGWMGAVLAKISVLVLIVMFIQKRPQGLFALKGRSAEN